MLTHGMIKLLSIELHETMVRPGTDEPSLTEIIMSRSNQELGDIETFYNNCKCVFSGFFLRKSILACHINLTQYNSRLWTLPCVRN